MPRNTDTTRAAGQGPLQAAATTPDAPVARAAGSVGDHGFTARWSASIGATGYRLDVSSSSSFSSYVTGYQDLDVGNATNRTIAGLSPSTTYYYRVRGYNGSGTSANSEVINVTTTGNVPAAPVARAAGSVGDHGFTARWSASIGATGYRLDVSSSSSFASYVTGYQDLDVGNTTNRTIGGLSPSTTYYYRVRGYNGSGKSPNSEVITVSTTGNVPAAPVARAAGSVGDHGFTARWSASIGATGYRLDVSSSSSFSSYVTGYQDLEVGNATNRTIAGLSPSTTYYYRVRGYNGSGKSPNSEVITVTTTGNVPAAPVARAAGSVGDHGFTARWSASTGATGYRLDVSSSSSFASYVTGYQDLDVGNTTNRTIAGLTPDTIYYYRVRAYNGSGTSANSSVITVTTTGNVPAAPVASAAASVSDTGFTARWSASTGATGYRLDVSSSDTFSSFVTGYQDLNVGNVTNRAVVGLSPGTAYYYRVRAYNGSGTSADSGVINVTTTDKLPPAPVANAASSVSNIGFTANWSPSAGATGYRLDVSSSNSFSSFVTGYQDLDVGNATNRAVVGLSASTTYHYRVRAYNGDGTSENSNVVVLTTFETDGVNLSPFQPSGWSSKLVVTKSDNSTRLSAQDDSFFTTADTVYVSWAQRNGGSTATGVPFSTAVLIDGESVGNLIWQRVDPLQAGTSNSIVNAPVGTLAAGIHTFTLKVDSTQVVTESNETDNDYTKTITIVDASFQTRPDLSIGFGSHRMVGDNVYNEDGSGQTVSAQLRPGKSKTSLLTVQNDSSEADTVSLTIEGQSDNFRVRFLSGKENITESVAGGTFRIENLPPGGSRVLKAVVNPRPSAQVGEVLSLRIHASSQADPAAQDTVSYEVTVK